MKRKVIPAILVVAMALAIPALGVAALPAPNWMPGSPILAGNQVILLWAPVPGAVKYFIYQNGTKIQESVSIQALLSAPEDAGTYEFQVSAVDASSAEGAKSSPGIVKIFKLTPPKNIEGRVIGKNIAIHWDSVAGAVLYNLYRSNESGKGFQLIDSLQDIRATDSNVKENQKYFYRVTSKDASGKESGPSSEAMVSTMVAKTEAAGKQNVVGLKTKELFTLKDKDFTDNGFVKIFSPYDVEKSPDGSRYYMSSVNTRTVLVFDGSGNFYRDIGGEDGTQEGSFQSPYGIGVGPDGRVFVVDSKKNNVQVFSPEGAFDRVFATVTRQEWMKAEPQLSDVAVDEDGNVYILEYQNAAVIKYSPSGKELSHFKKRGLPTGDETGYTPYLKVRGAQIYIGDGARGRVVITDPSGKTLKTVGVRGTGVGMLAAMGGFDISSDGKVYIVDRQTHLVQVYKLSDGDYLFTLANEKNDAPMPIFTPVSIAVDAGKKEVVVATGLNNSVAGFEMIGSAEEAKGK